MNAAMHMVNQMVHFGRNLMGWCFTRALWMGYRSVVGHWCCKHCIYNSILFTITNWKQSSWNGVDLPDTCLQEQVPNAIFSNYL